jgi:gliding motility-associated lipoprotein GldH
MNQIKNKKNIFITLCCALLLLSCNGNSIYNEYKNIDKEGWHEDSLAVFKVAVTDTINDYNVVLNIRSRNEYPYQNLFLFIRSYSPDKICVSDTLNCILSDNQGRWYGKGIGSTSNLPILYMSKIKFPKKGIYKFEIGHGMRETILKGMSDIGLKVEKVKSK